MMKYGKFIIYLFLSVLMIVLALFLFSYSNTIYQKIYRTPEFIEVETDFYYLFLYMILLLVIPFTAFFILAVIELSKLMGQLRSSVLEQQNNSKLIDDQLKETSENQKEQEHIHNKQAEEKKNNLIDCFKKNIPTTNKDHKIISEAILSCIGKYYELAQGEVYLRKTDDNTDKLIMSAAYAYYVPEEKIFEFEVGEGLIGQVAKQGEPLLLDNIPQGYINVSSGLGSATPNNLIIFPIISKINKKISGIIELASFKPFSKHDIELFKDIGEEIGGYLDNIDEFVNPKNKS